MVDLKLARLPDRTPVKLNIVVMPDLAAALSSYAVLYGEKYGQEVSVTELIPAILSNFLESDRAFAATRKSKLDR